VTGVVGVRENQQPPTVYLRPLGRFKTHALVEDGALANRTNPAIKQRWPGCGEIPKGAFERPQAPARGGLAPACEAARQLTLPLSKESGRRLTIAVPMPMTTVGATQLLLKDLLSFVRRLLR
jgi:hypothetical protein